MPGTIKGADIKSYFVCPKCSEEQGEQVVYHKSAVTVYRPMFTEQDTAECPKGHEGLKPMFEAEKPA